MACRAGEIGAPHRAGVPMRRTARGPVVPADPEGARADRRSRALEEPLDVRARPDARFLRLEVTNPVRQTHYDVLFPEFPSLDAPFCTCTDFARRGIGTCKHIEAARIWLADPRRELPAPPPRPPGAPVWEEIDRRERGLPKLRSPAPRRLRHVGDALLVGA